MLTGHRYIVVGGATKAGTTSVFSYFGDHPDVCASNMKETRFFVDPSYPVETRLRYENGLDYYNGFFQCQESIFRVEATPDYLYCPRAVRLIKKSLKDVKFIFILREPIERLISWYRFAQQKQLIPPEWSFEDYINHQSVVERNEGVPQHLRCLEQGRYAVYLSEVLRHVATDDVLITWFDDLRLSPRRVMTRMCTFSGVDASFYENYVFSVKNRTRVEAPGHRVWAQALLDKYARTIRRYARHVPVLHTVFRRLARGLREDAGPSEKQSCGTTAPFVSEQLRRRLRSYYRADHQSLCRLLGEAPPWRNES